MTSPHARWHRRLRTAFVGFMVVVIMWGTWRTQQISQRITRNENQTCQNRATARDYIRETIAEKAVVWTAEDQAKQDRVFAKITCP